METLEAIQARHRKEQRDLQSRITSKKKNATKKTRKGVNDECTSLERDLKERQEQELAALNGSADPDGRAAGDSVEEPDVAAGESIPSTEVNGVTEQLRKATVTFDIPTQATESDTQTSARSQEQGGKKRNRQKERMARRVAERESAAEAAEQEAQHMTDHRGLERSALERTFNAHGLVEHEIQPDGHCLFSAIADQLVRQKIPISPSSDKGVTTGEGISKEQTVAPYKVVRKVATDYMETHPDDFAPFLEEPLESYVPKIRDTAEWGGQLELLALARAYQIEIKVVQDGRTETIEPSGGGHDDDGKGAERGRDKTIWLAYYRHGYGLGEHYNSLRKKS